MPFTSLPCARALRRRDLPLAIPCRERFQVFRVAGLAMRSSMAVMRRRQQAEQGLDAARNAGDEEQRLDALARGDHLAAERAGDAIDAIRQRLTVLLH